jgi:hypothetical protein
MGSTFRERFSRRGGNDKSGKVYLGARVTFRERSGAGADARVPALLYSLIEWAKLAGVEPRAYLSEAARRAIGNPGTIILARDLKSSKSIQKTALNLSEAKGREWPRIYHQSSKPVFGSDVVN